MDTDASYFNRRITGRAVKFIKGQYDKSFFLYAPHPFPHGHWQHHPKSKKYAQVIAKGVKALAELYSPAIYEIDWLVVEILSTLIEKGTDENTIMIFKSDNGATVYKGSTKTLSEHKGQSVVGGMPLTTVIRWPVIIKAGSKIDQRLISMDVRPLLQS